MKREIITPEHPIRGGARALLALFWIFETIFDGAMLLGIACIVIKLAAWISAIFGSPTGLGAGLFLLLGGLAMRLWFWLER